MSFQRKARRARARALTHGRVHRGSRVQVCEACLEETRCVMEPVLVPGEIKVRCTACGHVQTVQGSKKNTPQPYNLIPLTKEREPESVIAIERAQANAVRDAILGHQRRAPVIIVENRPPDDPPEIVIP